MDFSVNYDVAVVGGGIAGVAAAIQAARSGQKTVMVEKNILLGGLATSGLVYIYLPICDGNGHQTSFGITEELLRNSITLGPGNIPENWDKQKNAAEGNRFCCRFSPAAYMLSLEDMLVREGVDLWLDTLVCDIKVKDNTILSAIVQNESGRGEIRAQAFVDASGSAILARRAGLPCLEEDNLLTLWAVEYARHASCELGQDLRVFSYVAATLDPPHHVVLPQEIRERMYPGKNDEEILKKITYRGLTGKTVSDFVTETHRLARIHYKLQREKGHDRDDCFALKLPLMPQFRKTYCLDAETVLKTGENNRSFQDSIGLIPDWRKPGPVWEVPFSSLYTRNMTNLIMAGRCTGASGDAWEITRVIPSAGLTGQVAGLAAAKLIRQGKAAADLDVTRLQDDLRDLGFKIHLEDIGLAASDATPTVRNPGI